jgi:hypothetical protein
LNEARFVVYLFFFLPFRAAKTIAKIRAITPSAKAKTETIHAITSSLTKGAAKV